MRLTRRPAFSPGSRLNVYSVPASRPHILNILIHTVLALYTSSSKLHLLSKSMYPKKTKRRRERAAAITSKEMNPMNSQKQHRNQFIYVHFDRVSFKLICAHSLNSLVNPAVATSIPECTCRAEVTFEAYEVCLSTSTSRMRVPLRWWYL